MSIENYVTSIDLSSDEAIRQNPNNTPSNFEYTLGGSGLVLENKNQQQYQICLGEFAAQYSWYNISDKYGNNKIKVRKAAGEAFVQLTFENGMYGYEDIEREINDVVGRKTVGERQVDKVTISLDYATLHIEILLTDDVEIDMREGSFCKLLGFSQKVISDARNVSETLPDITRGIDMVHIKCSLIRDEFPKALSKLLFSFHVSGLNLRETFEINPNVWKWRNIDSSPIEKIRIEMVDGTGTHIDIHGTDVNVGLIIRENISRHLL